MPSDLGDILEGVTGKIAGHEADLLRRLAAGVERGCVVEVGSFRGMSAIALAAGARQSGRIGNPLVYCVEPHRAFVGVFGGQFGPADRTAFFETLLRRRASEDIALVNLSSEEVTPGWTQPVGLLFLYGDHRYAGVARDFQCWDRHVLLGGHVAFHDAGNPDFGPGRLIGEILKQGAYERVDGADNLAVLRKVRAATTRIAPRTSQRLLVACENIVVSGGHIRFDRIAASLRGWGHELVYCTLGSSPERATDVPVITFEEAADASWDAVMVPGAGFSPEVIERFSLFRRESFGTRVQHVLNDQTRRAAFKAVNDAFKPDVVIFNNLQWPAGSFTEFSADRFHTLVGAVDAQAFRPAPYRRHPGPEGPWTIGGQANKYPEPLVAALAHLPAEIRLKLFGPDTTGLAQRHGDLIASGRLELTGPIFGPELTGYYGSVDCVVITEMIAGWANAAAEALASGVPLICTPHGTEAFAKDFETALVLAEPGPAALAEAIQRLRSDGDLCRRLAIQGRSVIERYGWDRYSQTLLALVQPPTDQHYFAAPELGLFGKWPVQARLHGLEPLLQAAQDSTILDLRSAEGIVGRCFLERGAAFVHGFERDAGRVAAASNLCRAWPATHFRQADLSDWPGFVAHHSSLLQERYDIVLYLGLHHHLPPHSRPGVLVGAARRARRYFAFRSPDAVFEQDGIEAVLAAEGFTAWAAPDEPRTIDGLGPCRVYKRSE